MSDIYKGSCRCGQIRFEVDEFAPRTGNCHCSMYRKFHAAAHARIAGAHRRHCRWTTGEDLLKGYTADNGSTRSFCRHCGSSLTFASPAADPNLVEIALGCFDDDLPQYEAGRDSKRLR